MNISKTNEEKLNLRVIVYIFSLFGISLMIFTHTSRYYGFDVSIWQLILLIGLAWILDLFSFILEKLGENKIKLTGGMIVNLIVALNSKPAVAFLVGFISSILPSGGRYEALKEVFNASQISIAASLSSLLAMNIPIDNHSPYFILKVIIVALFYVGLNSMTMFGLFVTLDVSKLRKFMSNMIPVIFLGAIPAGLTSALGVFMFNYMGYYSLPIVGGIFALIRLMHFYRSKYIEAKLESLIAMVKALEEKDKYTRGHSERTAKYAELLGKKLGYKGNHLEMLRLAALLHDIGKIGIPDAILNKPIILTKEEYDQIKKHPVKGAEIIKPFSYLSKIVPWIRYHHEAWDGSGYPDGLKGNDIPEEARIIAIADVYDALTSRRSYRLEYDEERALEILRDMKGTRLDPKLVDLFIEALKEHKRKEKYGEEA